MKKRSNSTSSGPPSTIASPELQIIENNVLKSDNSHQLKLASASSSQPTVEQKETYVNMMYPSMAASCSTEVPTVVGNISPIDDDDDAEMLKGRVKKSSLGPFRLGSFGIMKSSSFRLKSISPPPCELTASSSPDDNNRMTFDGHLPPQKATLTSVATNTNSATRPSRLKKFFLFSRADPSRKRPKDISLRNLRHVL